jgi:hypothetical protein
MFHIGDGYLHWTNPLKSCTHYGRHLYHGFRALDNIVRVAGVRKILFA